MSKYYSFKEEELVKLLNSVNDHVNEDNMYGYLKQSNAIYCNSDQNYTHIVYAYPQENAQAIMHILNQYNIQTYAVPDDWRLYHIISADVSIVDELNRVSTVCAVYDDSNAK